MRQQQDCFMPILFGAFLVLEVNLVYWNYNKKVNNFETVFQTVLESTSKSTELWIKGQSEVLGKAST